jgi:glycerate-2-kinase
VATAAAAPGPALARRLERLKPRAAPWIIALGKAALPMARAAVQTLAERGLEPAGGLIVPPAPAASPHRALVLVPGDHPEPGPGSLAAAGALAEVAARASGGEEVWVLLSGGTTSLLGAPVHGIAPQELTALYALLLGSGLDITEMNRIRKRFSRWGAGRLALALAPAPVRVYVVSDVIGDDLASIGSGPCVPDPSTAAEVRALLEGAGLWDRVPESVRGQVRDVGAAEPHADAGSTAGVRAHEVALRQHDHGGEQQHRRGQPLPARWHGWRHGAPRQQCGCHLAHRTIGARPRRELPIARADDARRAPQSLRNGCELVPTAVKYSAVATVWRASPGGPRAGPHSPP